MWWDITEKFLQDSGFEYDERSKEYYFSCDNGRLYVIVQLEPDGFCDVMVEVNETRGWLNHITTQQQLKELVKALSGEEI